MVLQGAKISTFIAAKREFMSKNLEELIKQTLNKSGKLDCGTAFKIANKLGIEVGEVSDEATRLGIKIDNCELGQFGGLDKDRGKFT